MQEKSSAEPVEYPNLDNKQKSFKNFKGIQKLLMLMGNVVPLLHILSTAALMFYMHRLGLTATILGVGLLYYCAPPVLARITLTLFPIRMTRITPDSREFFTWWFLINLQGSFNRFPATEEWLRIFPGIYSAWLRLWGSRIGSTVFWSPGTKVLDRSFLDIGDRVIFGAGVRLNPHVLDNITGELQLILATIKIGDFALVGGYSLITAGTEIMPGEVTKATLLSPPFSIWKNGRRMNQREVRQSVEAQ